MASPRGSWPTARRSMRRSKGKQPWSAWRVLPMSTTPPAATSCGCCYHIEQIRSETSGAVGETHLWRNGANISRSGGSPTRSSATCAFAAAGRDTCASRASACWCCGSCASGVGRHPPPRTGPRPAPRSSRASSWRRRRGRGGRGWTRPASSRPRSTESARGRPLQHHLRSTCSLALPARTKKMASWATIWRTRRLVARKATTEDSSASSPRPCSGES